MAERITEVALTEFEREVFETIGQASGNLILDSDIEAAASVEDACLRLIRGGNSESSKRIKNSTLRSGILNLEK